MLRRVGARSLQNGVEPGADSGGGGLHGSAADLRNGNSKGERMGAVTISRAASSQLPVTRFQMPAYSYSYSARRAVLVLDPHSHPEDIALRSSARVRVPSSVVPSEGSRGSSIPDLCRVASRLLPIVLVLSPEGGTRTRDCGVNGWDGCDAIIGPSTSRSTSTKGGRLETLKSPLGSWGHSPHRPRVRLSRGEPEARCQMPVASEVVLVLVLSPEGGTRTRDCGVNRWDPRDAIISPSTSRSTSTKGGRVEFWRSQPGSWGHSPHQSGNSAAPFTPTG